MSLTWDVSRCEDYRSLTTDAEAPITEALIFATMAIGMGELTETNFDKFATRLNVWAEVAGPLVTEATDDGLRPVPITVADLRRRIGLRTNVSTMTDARFKANIFRLLMDKARSTVERQKRAAERDAEAASH